MEDNSKTRRGRHCIFKMHVHLVFVTKYRRCMFDAAAIDALRDIFQDVCRNFQATLVQMDGEDDPVHLLIEYPPKVPVCSLVNSLKGVSSRLLRQRRPDIRKRYWRGVLWSPSYFAASCGGSEPPRRRAFQLRHECRSFGASWVTVAPSEQEPAALAARPRWLPSRV